MNPPTPPASPRSLRQRLTRAVVAATALIVLVGVVATAALVQTSRRTEDLVDQVSPARIAASELQAALLEQQAGVSGFLLTRQEKLLDSYQRGLARERDVIRRLRTLIDDRPMLEPTWPRSNAAPFTGGPGMSNPRSPSCEDPGRWRPTQRPAGCCSSRCGSRSPRSSTTCPRRATT